MLSITLMLMANGICPRCKKLPSRGTVGPDVWCINCNRAYRKEYKQKEKARKHEEWAEVIANSEAKLTMPAGERILAFCSRAKGQGSKKCVVPCLKKKGDPWDWNLTDAEKKIAHAQLARSVAKWSNNGTVTIPSWRYALLIAVAKSNAKQGGKPKSASTTPIWVRRKRAIEKAFKQKVTKERQEAASKANPIIQPNTMLDGGRLEGI